MYKETKCPLCNGAMIGEFKDGKVTYKCPSHARAKRLSQTTKLIKKDFSEGIE